MRAGTLTRGHASAHSAQPERGIETRGRVGKTGHTTWVLIQHNPNEGLKLPRISRTQCTAEVLIQHNPNEGLKRHRRGRGQHCRRVLIQHNPNEGLKPNCSAV